MILRLLPVLCLVLFLTACGRKSQTANPPPVSSATQVDANAAPASQPTVPSVPQSAASAIPSQGPPVRIPTEQTVIPANANWDVTLTQLSDALRAYVSNTRSVPRDFQDFVARSLVQAPAPPPGKAYAIQGGKVVLVNQ